jgi:hypothetical protein
MLTSVLRRLLTFIATSIALTLRAVISLVALCVRYTWRGVLGFAILSALFATISVLLLGHLPTSHFWQGAVLALLVVGALIMARGPRALLRPPQQLTT